MSKQVKVGHGGCLCGDSCSSSAQSGDCGHEHGHSHGEDKNSFKKTIAALVASAALIAVSFFIPGADWIKTIILIVATLISGGKLFFQGIKSVFKLRLDEKFLLAVAVVAAFAIGDGAEGAFVALFFALGEFLEEYASMKSRKSIAALSEIQADTANIRLSDGTLKTVAAGEIQPGGEIVVLPHERIPLDGVVVEGTSTLDASAITGEALPVSVFAGSTVMSGMINQNETLVLKTTASLENSAASRIIEMVENAVERKGRAHKLITRFSKIYIPVVVICAVLIFVIPTLITGDWYEYLRRSLVFLVASCPCALVLSVPLGFFSGIGAAAKRGIIVKGGIFLEKLAKAKVFVFDKTGTLTTGELEVEEVTPAKGFTREEVLRFAGAGEFYSGHPIAKAITAEAGAIDETKLSGFSEIAGGGTSVIYEGETILCGGKRLMESNGADVSAFPDSAVYVVKNNEVIGSISLFGKIREDASSTISGLRKCGAEKFIMLTGDNEEQASLAAKTIGIDEFRAGMLPEDKQNELMKIQAEYGDVVYVGDGINDAPVLAQADAGVAMGLGNQVAAEAADIILTGASLSSLLKARNLFEKTMKIINFNIVFSIAIKVIVLVLGAFGMAVIWAAVFADVGVMIITVLNSARLLLKKPTKKT